MAGRKSNGGAKRGPKPQARREDVEAVQKVVNKILRRLNEIHAIVVPDSKANEPDPEEVVVTPPAEAVTAPTEPVNGAAVLPVEAEVVVTPAAPVQSSLNLKPANG